MRRNLLVGVVLAVAAAVVVLVSAALDLELESVALLGAGLGAVVALVPDRSPLIRLLGFAAGFVVGFLGYAARALLLPDTASGRAVAVALAVLLCVGVVAATLNRLPLWSVLLGAAAVAGAYEFTYAEAPPEMATTAVSTATTLLLNVAVGYFAAALIGPGDATPTGRAHRNPSKPRVGQEDAPSTKLNDMMETTR